MNFSVGSAMRGFVSLLNWLGEHGTEIKSMVMFSLSKALIKCLIAQLRASSVWISLLYLNVAADGSSRHSTRGPWLNVLSCGNKICTRKRWIAPQNLCCHIDVLLSLTSPDCPFGPLILSFGVWLNVLWLNCEKNGHSMPSLADRKETSHDWAIQMCTLGARPHSNKE